MGDKAAAALGDSLVGVTVWRLRKAEQQDDPGIRIVSREGNEQWTPIRVEGKPRWEKRRKCALESRPPAP